MVAEAAVRVGLLGPLEVTVGGAPLELKGARRRAIFAVLAAAQGRTVGTDLVLQDAFFDTESPQPNTLHVHVSQLRALLRPHEGALVRHGAGYRLDCGSDAAELDAAVAEAREQGPAAAGRLRAALAAVRGEFCEDVPVPALEGRRTYYRDLRLTASELLFDAELTDGGGDGLPERIEALLATEPLRERLWGQLMLALFATGRQTDALAAYRRARDVLLAEGGLDPGPQLRELEAMVLRQADSVDRAAPVLPASRAPTLVWLDAGGTLTARPLLAEAAVVIGRAEDCDIRIDWDPLVSRRHASVHRTATGFEVRDLGSTNGCSVDGRRVRDVSPFGVRGTLQVGDTLLFLRAPTQRVSPRNTTRKAGRPESPD